MPTWSSFVLVKKYSRLSCVKSIFCPTIIGSYGISRNIEEYKENKQKTLDLNEVVSKFSHDIFM